MKIPLEYRKAYQNELIEVDELGNLQLALALRWAVAGWLRAEFYDLHASELPICIGTNYEFVNGFGVWHYCADPCHTWTDEQWQAEAEKLLGETEET